MKRTAAALIFIIHVLFSVNAQTGSDYHRTDDLVFKLAVYGPSDEIFIWWGHAAIIAENTRWNTSRVFDWGIFTYPSDNFLKEFINDNVQYRCESGYFDPDFYIGEDRDMYIYTLNLDRQAKETILAYAENNVQPANCYYDYHEFRDNCSTRIRDIIDMGTGGQFSAAFGDVPGRFSIKQHVRRFTWFRPFSDWFLGLLMGRDLDRKITVWDEMFLPVEIGRNIVNFSYTDESGVPGKLVSNVQVLNSSKQRPPILNAPVNTLPFALAAGMIATAIIFFTGWKKTKFQFAGRIIWSAVNGICGLFFGICGCVLFLGLYLMNNDYFQQNINILFINPLLLGIVPLSVMCALDRPKRINPGKILSIVWTCVFATGCLALLVSLPPFLYQDNGSILAVILPIAFSLGIMPGIIMRQAGHFYT